VSSLPSAVLRGAAAGAAGTTALNATTYLDMAIRGRPASRTPEATVERLSDLTGVDVPGDEQARQGRVSGLGALTGILAGVGVGAVLGGLRGAGLRLGPATGPLVAGALAMVAGNGPMARLGVSNPRQWSATDWAADLVPHLAYGVVTWFALEDLG
jgi:hypothetical protein